MTSPNTVTLKSCFRCGRAPTVCVHNRSLAQKPGIYFWVEINCYNCFENPVTTSDYCNTVSEAVEQATEDWNTRAEVTEHKVEVPE